MKFRISSVHLFKKSLPVMFVLCTWANLDQRLWAQRRSSNNKPEPEVETPEAAKNFIPQMWQFAPHCNSLNDHVHNFYKQCLNSSSSLVNQKFDQIISELETRHGELKRQFADIKRDPAWDEIKGKKDEWKQALTLHHFCNLDLSRAEVIIATLKKDSAAFKELASIGNALEQLDQRLSIMSLDILVKAPQGALSAGEKEKLRLQVGSSLREIASEQRSLWERFKPVSLYLDERQAYLSEYDPRSNEERRSFPTPMWSQSNPIAQAFASLRDRMIGLRNLWGLDAAQKRGGVGIRPEQDKFRDFDVASVQSGFTSVVDHLPVSELGPRKMAKAQSHWSGFPNPSSPIQIGPLRAAMDMQREEARWQAGRRKPDEQEKIAVRGIYAMRAQGLTITYGNPEGWREYVHEQTGQTCGFGAQVCMLRIAGAVPERQSPEGTEYRLFNEARRLNMLPISATRNSSLGLHHAYLGSFLTMRDLPVVKHYNAQPQQLDESLRQGLPVLAAVDGGIFYSSRKLEYISHAIVVTGMEVGLNGQTLGYYVNDTGSGEGGMLIPTSQFRKAWIKKRGGFYVAPK